MIDTKKELRAQMRWNNAHRTAAEHARFVVRNSKPEEMCEIMHKVMTKGKLSEVERKLIAAAIVITLVAVVPKSTTERNTNLQ